MQTRTTWRCFPCRLAGWSSKCRAAILTALPNLVYHARHAHLVAFLPRWLSGPTAVFPFWVRCSVGVPSGLCIATRSVAGSRWPYPGSCLASKQLLLSNPFLCVCPHPAGIFASAIGGKHTMCHACSTSGHFRGARALSLCVYVDVPLASVHCHVHTSFFFDDELTRCADVLMSCYVATSARCLQWTCLTCRRDVSDNPTHALGGLVGLAGCSYRFNNNF